MDGANERTGPATDHTEAKLAIEGHRPVKEEKYCRLSESSVFTHACAVMK
jgi:hypothetical protein